MVEKETDEIDYKKEMIKKFVPLKNLFLEENEEIKKITTLYQREEQYADIIGPIEHSIAGFYVFNRNLKDSDVAKIIKNIKLNYYKDVSFFNQELEQLLMCVMSIALQERNITKHEFFLILNYILWSIDNRDYLGSRGYLDWLLEFFEIDEDTDSDEYGDENENEKYPFITNIEDEDKLKEAITIAKKKFNPSPKIIERTRKESEEFMREVNEKDSLWKKGGFIQSVNPSDQDKMKTFHMGHDEDVNYDCKKCGKKISAHNRDWHNGMCDKCFNDEHFPEPDYKKFKKELEKEILLLKKNKKEELLKFLGKNNVYFEDTYKFTRYIESFVFEDDIFFPFILTFLEKLNPEKLLVFKTYDGYVQHVTDIDSKKPNTRKFFDKIFRQEDDFFIDYAFSDLKNFYFTYIEGVIGFAGNDETAKVFEELLIEKNIDYSLKAIDHVIQNKDAPEIANILKELSLD